MRRREETRSISVWGTGTPRRELLYSEDLGEACVFLANLADDVYGKMMNEEEAPLINIGTGLDLTIRELATLVCQVLDFDGTLIFDSTRPDGTPRKLMDVSRMEALGWRATTTLEEGIRLTINSAKPLIAAGP